MDVRMLYDDNTQQLFQGDDTELQYYLDYTQEQERYQQDAYNRSRYGPGIKGSVYGHQLLRNLLQVSLNLRVSQRKLNWHSALDYPNGRAQC